MPDIPGYTDTGGGDPGLFPWWDQGGTPPPTSPGYPPEGAPPNTPFPGSPPSTPYTPDVAPPPPPPPSEPPVTQPPPVGFDPTPSPVDTGINWIAGIGGSFFRSRVGRRLPSPFERLITTGTRAAVKGLTDYFRGPRVLPMAPPAPPGKPPDLYRPDVFRMPPASVLPYVLSRITALGALLYPTPIGETPLTPRERLGEIVPEDYGSPNWYGPRTRVPGPPIGDQRKRPDVLLENVPRPVDTGFRAFLRRELSGQGSDYGDGWLRQQLGLPPLFGQRGQGPPEPQVNIADIKTPAAVAPPVANPVPAVVGAGVPQQTVSSTRGSSKVGRAPRPGRIFTFGGIGTAVLLIEASRRGRASNPSVGGPSAPILPAPIVPVSPIDTVTPLTPQQPSVQSYAPSFYGGGSGIDYCVPRPRGPKRKCLERAPVKYSGGRRKGKAAGTKCLRWEAPKR